MSEDPPEKKKRERHRKKKTSNNTNVSESSGQIDGPSQDLSVSEVKQHNQRNNRGGSSAKKDSTSLNPMASEFTPKGFSSNPLPAEGVSSQDSALYCMESKQTLVPSQVKKERARGRGKPSKPVITSAAPETEDQAVVEEQTVVEEPGAQCMICMDEYVKYYAVGDCNHHICCMCAIRLRIKNKDYNCVLCKKNMDILIVYNASRGLLNYESFNVSAEDLYSVTPMMNGDPQHKIIYSECNEQYRAIENLRAIACPILVSQSHQDVRSPKVLCGERFASTAALLKHMSDRHNGLTLCRLCLDHRPLFISEHIVFTPASLKLHNKFGDTTVPKDQRQKGGVTSSTFNSDKNRLMVGHKLCAFCDEYFYDSATLYTHMQTVHFTCFLCPPAMMFRYYANMKSLREHYRSDHIVCEICDQDPHIQESGMNVSFQDFREYSGHMEEFHGLSASQLMNNFRVGVGINSTTRVGVNGAVGGHRNYLDLDMGTANPNYTGGAGATGRNAVAAAAAVAASGVDGNGVPLIPANMQIAGRVTGTGRFAPLSQSDLAMQEYQREQQELLMMRSQQATAGGGAMAGRSQFDQHFPTLGGGPAPKNTGTAAAGGVKNKKAADFPALGGSSDTSGKSTGSAASTTSAAAAAALHPLSVVARQQQQQKEQLARAKEAANAVSAAQEQEERRLKRNMQLAESFYGTGTAAATNAALGSLTMGSKVYANSVMTSLGAVGTEYDLLRTLYPAMLITWSKTNMNELLKIEKKISTLLADKALNSVQLKPMSKPMRSAVHNIAKFYFLNSYQFDSEPNCYCSLVKTILSSSPLILISKAVVMGAFNPPLLQTDSEGAPINEQPVIFIQLNNNSLSANASYCTDGSKSYTASCTGNNQNKLTLHNVSLASGVFNVAQVITKLLELVQLTPYYAHLRSACVSESNAATVRLAVSLLHITKVKASGANAFGIEFESVSHALQCYSALSEYLASRPTPTSVGVLHANSSKEEEISIFLSYFSIFPAFSVASAASAGGGAAAASAASGVASEDGFEMDGFGKDGDPYVTPLPKVAFKAMPTNSNASPSVKSAKSASAAGAGEGSSGSSSSSAAVAADAADVPNSKLPPSDEVTDDWEEFLAEHRNRAAAVNSKPSVASAATAEGSEVPTATAAAVAEPVARYVPKRTYATLPDVAVTTTASFVPMVSSQSTSVIYHNTIHSSVVNDPNSIASSVVEPTPAAPAVYSTSTSAKKDKTPAAKKGNAFDALLLDDEDDEVESALTEGAAVASVEDDDFEMIEAEDLVGLSVEEVVNTAHRRRLFEELQQQPGLTVREILVELEGSDASTTADEVLMNIILKRN